MSVAKLASVPHPPRHLMAPPVLQLVGETAPERCVYQPARSRPVALVGSIALVASATAALLLANFALPAAESSPPLTIVSMELLPQEPPPPPPAETMQEPPSAAVVVAPPPVVVVPQPPAPTVITVAVPPPPSPPEVPAMLAPGPATPAVVAPRAGPVEGGDLSGKMIAAPPPSYPIEARKRREQGTVRMQVLVGTDGSVADVAIASSSGSFRLDRAALEAVRRWRWSPMIREGRAVLVRGFVIIPFVLRTDTLASR